MPPDHPLCAAKKKDGRPCTYRATSGDFCCNHDPAQQERRKAAGRTRHPRFTQRVGEATFDRAKVPTIAQIVDRLLDIELDLAGLSSSLAAQVVAAKVAAVRVAALKGAREALLQERAYADAKTAREKTLGAGGVSSPEAVQPPMAPWLQPVAQ